jgi:ABC-type branched-subunit amino acid transport system substrate-binding protein
MAFSSLRPQAGASLTRLALLALLSLSVAGCQLVPRSRADRGAPPPDAEIARGVEEDEAGPPLPAGETRNRVAVLVPLTGANAAVGQSIANAANLALADTGSTRIRITAYDTARGPLLAAQQALAAGNGLFLGPLLAEDALAIAPLARRANVPVIAFSNDVSIAGDGVHVLGLNPAQSIVRVIGFALERGMERFAALLPTGVYGDRAGIAISEAVRGAGGRLVAVRTYDRTAETLRESAADLASQGPFDAVLIADGARMAALAVPILRRGSPQLRVLGTELWSNEAVGAQAALRGAWFAGPPNANFNALRSRYRTRYGANPHRLASLGYDAVLLAVRVADGWRLGRRFPVRALRDEDGYSGVDGAFRFGRDGIAERALEVQEVTASGLTILSPAPASFRGR